MAYTRLTLLGAPGPVVDITAVIPTVPGIPPALPDDIEVAGPWERHRDPTLDPDDRDILDRGIFSMTYDGITIDMPFPILGDVQNLQSTVVNRRTRGGKAKVYRDPQWYSIHSYEYTFKKVNETKKDDFLTFVEEAMGDPITVVDHLGHVFIDMYITVVGPVIEEHDDGCSYTLSIILQVVR